MDYANVVDDGETVLWEGRPRQRRIFAVQDLFMVPISLIWTGAAVAGATISDLPWSFKAASLTIAAYLTAGRFFYKAVVKSQTRYLVTNRRALVLRQGEVFEHQELDGVTPEITGWNHNRIVTFGDTLDATLAGSTSIGKPAGNLGLPTGRFGVRRGDGSAFPIRFYDLSASEGDRLMVVLKQRARRPLFLDDDHAATTASPVEAQSDRQSSHVGGDVLQTRDEQDEGTTFATWVAASQWRAVLLPVAMAAAVSLGTAALTHSPGKGLLPGILAGLGSYLAYRRKYGTTRKR